MGWNDNHRKHSDFFHLKKNHSVKYKIDQQNDYSKFANLSQWNEAQKGLKHSEETSNSVTRFSVSLWIFMNKSWDFFSTQLQMFSLKSLLKY